MKNKKGISLIVLVITIIVIIILAGAVILNLSSNNPVESANKAKFLSNLDNFKNELLLYNTKQISNTEGVYDLTKLQANNTSVTYTGAGVIDTTGKTIADIITVLKGASDITDFEIQNGKLVYVGTDEIKQTWATTSGVNNGSEGNTPTGLGVNVIATDNATIDGNDASYNNPIIPKGFMAINTTDASWNNLITDYDKGLVIQDAKGNEFVWVPVDGTNVTYTKWCTTNIAYNNANISDDTLPTGFNESNITTKYKGFYIARYESAFDYNSGSIRVTSKRSTNSTRVSNWSTIRNATYDGYLWNYINYTDAKQYSENMATAYSYDTTKVGTNLITGGEWDTVMKWIQNSGKNVTTDSTSFGNYSNATFNYDYPTSGTKAASTNTLLVSGASSYTKVNNIYDLAGNLFEWTSEKYTSNYVVRGGNYSSSGSVSPVASRGVIAFTSANSDTSFRVGLYIL